jgi:thiosulfate/3-mercaptopyruvate sulfurtransferase
MPRAGAAPGNSRLIVRLLADACTIRSDRIIARDTRVTDVLSMAEYTGLRFWPSLPPAGDQRGGHMSGAMLVPIEDTWREDGCLKSPDDLRRFYMERGFNPDHDIITYCAVSGRAS